VADAFLRVVRCIVAAYAMALLLDIVRGVFDIPRDIEVTLEGIPQTFSHDKLLAMRQSGMWRAITRAPRRGRPSCTLNFRVFSAPPGCP